MRFLLLNLVLIMIKYEIRTKKLESENNLCKNLMN